MCRSLFRQPAKLLMDLRRVNGIAQIVSFAVTHMGDESLRLVRCMANQLHGVDIPHLIMAADIIDLSEPPLIQHKVNCLAVVVHIEPVPHIQPLPIDGQGLVVQRVDDHQGDQLLRELIRTVIVAASGDGHGQAVHPMVHQNQQIGRGLGGTVWTRRMDGRILREEKIRSIQRQVPYTSSVLT